MRQSIADKKTWIQRTLTKHLEDLEFIDDISIFSHEQQEVKETLCRVSEEAEKTSCIEIKMKAISLLLKCPQQLLFIALAPHFNTYWIEKNGFENRDTVA